MGRPLPLKSGELTELSAEVGGALAETNKNKERNPSSSTGCPLLLDKLKDPGVASPKKLITQGAAWASHAMGGG